MRYKLVKQVVFIFNTYVIRAVRDMLNPIRHDLSAVYSSPEKRAPSKSFLDGIIMHLKPVFLYITNSAHMSL
ncbi:hypothetical protein Hanom_Chr02g00122741 [Helianthus anomalus]